MYVTFIITVKVISKTIVDLRNRLHFCMAYIFNNNGISDHLNGCLMHPSIHVFIIKKLHTVTMTVCKLLLQS